MIKLRIQSVCLSEVIVGTTCCPRDPEMLRSHIEGTCSQVPGVLCLFCLLVDTSNWPHRLLVMVAFVSGGELVWPLVLDWR